MLFRQLFDKDSSTYTYLIADPDSQEAILVDTVLEQTDRDLQLLTELGLTLRYCLETHVHADHVMGVDRLRGATGCMGIVPIHAPVSCADRRIEHGELLSLGEILVEAIATPGHTDSHMAYRINGHRVLTGDALFIRGFSTIAEEKRWNPRFAGRSRQEFIEFMNNLNLPNPKKMMEAVPANELCGRMAMIA
ncbi:MAG: MBL fold metallo-hydrolase [Cyanobacteria bacterium J06621_3]